MQDAAACTCTNALSAHKRAGRKRWARRSAFAGARSAHCHLAGLVGQSGFWWWGTEPRGAPGRIHGLVCDQGRGQGEGARLRGAYTRL